MEYIVITEAVHPTTKEVYKVGERICIYQGRFGHNNILTIGSMFTDSSGEVYVSENIYSEEDYQKKYPHNPTGTYINAIKHKISDKEMRKIINAQSIANKYH